MAENILGKRIKRARLLQDLEQKKLAQKAGLTIPYMSKLENGLVDPRWSVVQRLADELGVSLNYLSGKEEVRL